jgi:hypothetical protein
MAISGLFHCGVLNDQDTTYLGVIKIVQPPSQSSTSKLASEANAKLKVKKKDRLISNAKCSCCLYSDYDVYYARWLNYCPECHRYGTLVFEETGDCPEGMIRCTNCDADYCAVHGKEHTYSHSAYLTPV